MNAPAISPCGRWRYDGGLLSKVGSEEQAFDLYQHTYWERDVYARFAPSGELVRVYKTEQEDDPYAGLITRGFFIAEVYCEQTSGQWWVVGGWAREIEPKYERSFAVVDVCWHGQNGLAVLSDVERNGSHVRVLEVRGVLDAFLASDFCRKHEARMESARWLIDEEGQWTELSFDASGLLHAADPTGEDIFDFAQHRRRRDTGPWRTQVV